MKKNTTTANQLTIEMWAIARVKPYEKNARKLSDKAVAKVAASLKEFGWRQPCVVDKKGVLVAGHTRLLAAQSLGMTEVPVHVASNLTPVQVRAYRLADNRVASESSFDLELLGPELLELQELDLDLSLTGFDADELKLFMADPTEGLTDPDDCPAPQAEAISVAGDLWLLGEHRLLCGDSTSVTDVERLMGGEKADMVFTDPPYNIASENKGVARNSNNKQMTILMASEWDKGFRPEEALASLYMALAPDVTVYITTSHHLAPQIWAWMKEWADHHSWCVWSKPNPMPSLMRRHWTWSAELVCYATRGKHTFNFPLEGHALSVWTMNKSSKCDLHPTMKPVEVPQHAIEHSSSLGQIVLDLFGGSGSTLIAAEATGRKARLMEIAPQYIDVICRRFAAFTGKQATLDGDGRTFAELEAERRPKSAAA